jgi:FkbM family methyltransferase
MKSLIKNQIKELVFKFIKPQKELVYNSYAQAGEDVILKFLFNDIGIAVPSYLELGVYKPDIGSNTFLFYQLGSRGVCVEADVTLIDKIKSVRKGDTVLNVGVGIKDEEEVCFYVFDEPSLNTLDKTEADFRVSQGTYKIDKVEKIKLLNINTIISQHFPTYPDLLSIDIEGMDLAVLQTLDFNKFPIPVICVETCTYSESHIRPKDQGIIDFMLTKNYFIYADTYINTIFVNNDWFYSGKRK